VTILEWLKEDVQTVFRKDPAARSTLEVLCCYPGLHAVWLHRLAHWLWRKRLRLLGRLVSHVSRWLTGIEIHPGAEIGRRFFVDHGMGVVIGETAQIGEDVLLYQGVVLGGTSLQKGKRHPTLGNDVVVGTGAAILGPITIGDGAKIGAGSVVVRPVQAGATVVGVPARPTGRAEAQRPAVDLRHGDLPDPVVRAISESLERSSRLEARIRELETAIASLAPAELVAKAVSATTPENLETQIREALGEVIDPGMGMSLSECGFVQDVHVDGQHAMVHLQLDDPNCAFKDYFAREIRRRVLGLDSITQVDISFAEHPKIPDGITVIEGSPR
jgi:serine O-acetyltransferase